MRAEGERIAVVLAEREAELAEIAAACRVVGRLVPASVSDCEVRPVASARPPVPLPRDPCELSSHEIAERIPGVLAKYPGVVRAGQVAADLGLEPAARQVERVRHALRRSAAQGVTVAAPGGAFALKR